MPNLKTISFLASHGGSCAKQIIAAIDSGVLPAKKGIIISNNRNSKIYQWCCQQNFAVTYISSNTNPKPEQEDKAILKALVVAKTDLVVLSGYMKKIKGQVLAHFANRIINVHPALLPKHGGEGMYGDRVHAAVLAAGDKFSGASVHLINEIYDDGQILGQIRVSVRHDDTLDSLKSRIQSIEAKLYIKVLKKILSDT